MYFTGYYGCKNAFLDSSLKSIFIKKKHFLFNFYILMLEAGGIATCVCLLTHHNST